MNKRVILIGLISLFVSAHIVKAQDILKLSVQEAEQYAIEHNRTMQNASLDIKQAKAARWQTLSSMLPQVSAGFSYQNYCGYELNMMGMPIPMNPSGTFNTTVSMALTGAQVVGTMLANLSIEMADITKQQTEQSISKSVRSVYLSILVMEKTVSLLDSSLVNLENLERTTINAVKAGAAEQVDADQISIQVNSMKNNINSTARSLEMLYNSLQLQLGADINTKIELTGSLDDILNTDGVKSLLLESFDINNNYDYQLLKKSEELTKRQVTMSWMDFLPTISVYYQYSKLTYFGKDAGFSMTPPNMIGASVNLPIFSSGTRVAKVKEAKINLQKMQNTIKSTEDALYVQERQLRYNLVSALENYENQADNIDVSQRVFNNILTKYKYGVSSSLDVTNASNNLITAQSNYVQSVMTLLNAQIELETLMNNNK
ncbi:MAG: TolC family protein [Bacteroidales bacterium]|nr:TolC family protein [Bacteroidales bacterium]